MAAPLTGLKVIEFAGLAPGPFCGLVLADWGASVIRIDRVDQPQVPTADVLCRGKRSIAVNVKSPEGRALVLKLICTADVLIDPFRVGALEKLGFGPDIFLGNGGQNKGLIYARLFGFPVNGPQQDMAGHDINYLAQSGVLSMLPGKDKPTFPLNILADFGGGGLTCALGILLAIIARSSSGCGQVVQTDMVSGSRYLASFPLLQMLLPTSTTFGVGDERGTRLLDGGAPFYGVYTCKDGKWMSVGCLEPKFFATFLDKFLDALPEKFVKEQGWTPTPAIQRSVADWPRLRDFLTKGFESKTRDEWTSVFHGSDACAAPVLSPSEAAAAAANSLPTPHPQLSQNKALSPPSNDKEVLKSLNLHPGSHTEEILQELKLGDRFPQLLKSGIVGHGISSGKYEGSKL